jgi:hypothetical protein
LWPVRPKPSASPGARPRRNAGSRSRDAAAKDVKAA